MVVAVVAVLIALGAPSYAAQLVQSVFYAQRAGNAKRVDGLKASTKPRPNTLLALNSHGKFPASVGLAGPPGPQGATGPQGDRGEPGAPGSALAYSVILYEENDEGTATEWRIDDTLSKHLDNDVNFSHPGSGVFCLHGLPFTVGNIVATPGPFAAGTPFDVQVDMARPGHSLDGVGNCPANTGAIVYTTDSSGKLADPNTSDTIFFELN
jgi:hypothetical protein